MKYSPIQVRLDIAEEWLADEVSWHSYKARLAKPESLSSKSDIVGNSGENFGWKILPEAEGMQMTTKIHSKRIRTRNAPLSSCNYERAEPSDSPLAHTRAMLGSLATMLVIARLIANPAHNLIITCTTTTPIILRVNLVQVSNTDYEIWLNSVSSYYQFLCYQFWCLHLLVKDWEFEDRLRL
jgi:hypothetical protein